MNFPLLYLNEKSADFQHLLYKGVLIIEEGNSGLLCPYKLGMYLSMTSLSSLQNFYSGFIPLPSSFHQGSKEIYSECGKVTKKT